MVSVEGSGEQSGPGMPGDSHRQRRRTVLVQVSAEATELPPIRLVAADLAARADFDLDAVADLRLAVDEAASELVAVAIPDASLTCAFTLDDERILVAASVPARSGTKLRQDSFGWRVLTTLVDEVEVSEEPDADPPRLGISLSKRRSAPADDLSGVALVEGR